MSFAGIWTSKGIQKMANAGAGGTALSITHLLLGDGNGTVPTVLPSQTALVNEKWRGGVNTVTVEADSTVVVETVIPYNIGGFFIREWALLDSENDIVAIGPHAEFYKPLLAEGSGAELVEQIKLPISSAGQVSVYVSSAALATRKYVDSELSKHSESITHHNYLGNMALMPFRIADLPKGWYFMNGDRFQNDTPQADVLNGFSANFKTDWGITNNGTSTNVPLWAYSDGRMPFMRAVNGVSRQVGSVEGDAIRNIVGSLEFAPTDTGLASLLLRSSGAFTSTPDTANFAVTPLQSLKRCSKTDFNSSIVVPTSLENRPLNFGMTPAIYLGV